MIFEFERPEDRNYTETVKTLAGLARFVVVELSGPSVPQELQATVPDFEIPFVPILKKGEKPYYTFRDFKKFKWVLPLVKFEAADDLLRQLPDKIVTPAEDRNKDTTKTAERIG